MKITIIGGSKGTGAQLAAQARKAGHEVIVLSRSGNAPEGIHVVRGDATDPAVAGQAVAGADAVVITVGGAKGVPNQRAAVTRAVIEAMKKEDVQRLRDVLLEPEEQSATPREHIEYVDKSELKGLAIEVDMNVKNVDYNLSKCCNPQPGDPIFAFVSVLKGIRIHRIDCPNAANIRERYPDRMIPAKWAKKS